MSKLASTLKSEEQLSILMARQPIFSKSQDAVAFELLFRREEDSNLLVVKDDTSTFDVVMNTYANIMAEVGQQRLPCYLKVTDKILLSDSLPQLPPSLFSLEILGRSDITASFIEKLKELAHKGYRIVLADYDPDNRRFDPLLNIIHVLKLDIQRLGLSKLPKIIHKLKPYQLDLLADKVETQDEFRQCLELGFSLYQGYFLSHPVPVKGKKIGASKFLLLQLLRELQQENATGASLEGIAINDPALTYKILKVVNSAAFNMPREIDSLSHAITLLGMEQIRRWIMLFLTTSQDGKPTELTRNMLVRGRMCELLAELTGQQTPMNYFIVGLLSQLDALFHIEIKELLQQVPLSQELKSALLHHSGPMGETLQDVENYERGKFDKIHGQIDSPLYEVAYRHSLKWSEQVMNALRG